MANNKLTEELHIEGLDFLGNAYGYDLYDARTYEAAQALTVGDTDRQAGEAWTGGEGQFNANINETLRLYFFVEENTNHVIMGCLNRQAIDKTLRTATGDINLNYWFQNLQGGAQTDLVLPLFLLPNIQYKGHDGLIINDNHTILGNYKGLIDPDHLPESVLLENINTINSNSFKDYPVPAVIISDSVSAIRENAFNEYQGNIRCYAESYEDTQNWARNWHGDNNNITWGINLTPEEIARREEAARLERERIEREQREREEAERRERELQNAETLGVLRYKEVGREVTILGCKAGRQKLDIPAEINGKPVTTIGPFAFFENEALTEVNLPETIKVIGKGAFYGCTNVIVKYPKNTIIYKDAFFNIRSARQY